jgi:tetratricopeptide (TPR) repeat protein
MDGRGHLWITDFGLAHCQSQAGLTMSGDLVGTLRYMSPEQALAQRVLVDHRTDIYSLGVTLYELLTLEPAFGGHDREELLRQIAFEEPRPPRRRNQAIPAELETIVLKALEKNPAERYATAQELADDLERFLKDEPIRARRPTLVQRARKWARRHQAAVWAAVVCISLTLLVVAITIGWAVRDRLARDDALDQTVLRTLEETGPLLEQRKWPEALGLVERADRLLAAAGRADRPPRLLDLQNDLSMAVRLEEIYGEPKRDAKLSMLIASGGGAGYAYQPQPEPSEEEFFAGRRQDERFTEAFRAFGIDLIALAPGEAAARMTPTNISPALVQALDQWAGMRKRARGEEDPFWKKLLEIAQQADPDPWRNQFRQALLRRDRAALEKLAEVVPLRKVPPATAYLLGLALEDLGALDKALAVLREAHRHHPDDFWLNDTLGWISRDSCKPPRYGDALRYYMATVVLRPRSWHTHWNLADTLDQKGAHDEALAERAKAIEVEPENPVPWKARGHFYREQRQYEKALADYTKAIELKPDYAEAWWERAGAYLHLDQYDKALADANRAVELDPKSTAAWNNRGAAYNCLHQYDKALADLNKAIELNPKNPFAWANRGNAYFDLRQYDKALADLNKAIELNPKNAFAWNNRGNAYLGLHQYDKALADNSKVIELDPKCALAWNNRGNAYLGLHKYDKALADYSKAIELDPNNAMAWANRGDVYQDLHNYEHLRPITEAVDSLTSHFSLTEYARAFNLLDALACVRQLAGKDLPAARREALRAWSQQGVEVLLEKQAGDGSWRKDLISTSWAVLFLAEMRRTP